MKTVYAIILMMFIGLRDGRNYDAERKDVVTEESAMLNMFPSEESWKNSDITIEKRLYFDSSFSKAFYQRDCEHETRLEPVYYYSGETVRIKCTMCNIALVLNGSPKGWARVKNIDNFIEKGEHFGSKDGPDIETVQNSENLEEQTSNQTSRKLGEPYYQQSEGALVIKNANSYSQGVYFCFDEDSVASQRHFYVLIPILPVFQVSEHDDCKIKEISNGCSDSKRGFPNHFWRNRNKAEPFDDQETCFTRNGVDDWLCYDYRKSTRTTGCENPASSCKTSLASSTLPMGVPITISLQWSSWSECENKMQTRIGQCFLSLDRQLTEANELTKKWMWLWKLNRMSNNLAFREGLPLFNGLLASWLYGVDSLDSCLDEELSTNSFLDGYDVFFSDVFDSIISNSTKLQTPGNAFKYCFKYEKINGTCDILQGTYTIDERVC